MFKQLSTTLALLGFIFTTSACTLSMERFGELISPSEEAPDSPNANKVKGTFPLGDPAFTGEFKGHLKATADGLFVFVTFDTEIIVTNNLGKVLHRFTPPDVHTMVGITGLTVDSHNKIYITGMYASPNENSLRFLRKYDLDGSNAQELVTYSDEDPDPGISMVGLPRNPVVTADGSIYVAVLNQIRKYDSSGTQVDSIGFVSGDGSGDGVPDDDGEIWGNAIFVVEPDGSVYVADTYSNRIQKFDSDGDYESQFPWPRQLGLETPGGMVRDSSGNFVVTESLGSGQVTSFSSTGTLLWTKDGTERGAAAYGGDQMTVTKYDNKYYVSHRDEIVIYGTDGTFLTRHVKMLNGGAATTRLSDGTFFVGAGNGIHKFNAKGEWQLSFASNRVVYGLVATDTTLYAADPMTAGLIHKYAFDGTSLGNINFGGVGQPFGLSIDKDKNLFVGDAAAMYKISTATEVSTPFGTGNYTMPIGSSPQKDGTVLLIDFNGVSMAIKRLNADGSVAAGSFDSTGPAAIGVAYNLTTGKDGKVYVGDIVGKKIIVYNADGTYHSSFGSADLTQPIGIYIDSFDDIFVSDGTANNVKKYNSAGVLQTE
ncbi:hypothetical protein ACNH6C_07440 [Bdellovibrio bacteriovorus]|uniref:hypothetical protein n=1 Tax=Bdellovibrio bacteriovorus TaxID=959 RepID=UPI003A812303